MVNWGTKVGWYIDLPETRERVSYSPKLYGKTLYFTSLAPNTSVCSYGGDSWDYFVNFLTGGAMNASPFTAVPFVDTAVSGVKGVPVRRKSEVGISPPGVSISTGGSQGLFFKAGSSGETESFGTNLSGTLGRRVAWRELTAD